MLPLKDVDGGRNGVPLMTWALILANLAGMILAWVALLSGSPGSIQSDAERLLRIFGLVPDLLLDRQAGGAFSILTSMFLHLNPLHFLVNMWALWIFGPRVEFACGSPRFLLFYCTAGTIGGFLHALVAHPSSVPTIGASGAIMGVMGAFLILFPRARIRTLLILKPLVAWPKVRAYWIIAVYFALDLVAGIAATSPGVYGGIAYWSHIGGFLSSIVIFLFLKPEFFSRFWSWQSLHGEPDSRG